MHLTHRLASVAICAASLTALGHDKKVQRFLDPLDSKVEQASSSKARDEGKTRFDVAKETGLRLAPHGPLTVDYWRDARAVFSRSCAACHQGDDPAGRQNLDADAELVQNGQYGRSADTGYRLAFDERREFGL